MRKQFNPPPRLPTLHPRCLDPPQRRRRPLHREREGHSTTALRFCARETLRRSFGKRDSILTRQHAQVITRNLKDVDASVVRLASRDRDHGGLLSTARRLEIDGEGNRLQRLAKEPCPRAV